MHYLPIIATKGGRGGKGKLLACPQCKTVNTETAYKLSALGDREARRPGKQKHSTAQHSTCSLHNLNTLQSSGAVSAGSELGSRTALSESPEFTQNMSRFLETDRPAKKYAAPSALQLGSAGGAVLAAQPLSCLGRGAVSGAQAPVIQRVASL